MSDLVEKAKVAEQAERYEDMAEVCSFKSCGPDDLIIKGRRPEIYN